MPEKRIIPKEVQYKFERLEGYRVIPVDGVWGGITNNKLIRMELFSECPLWVESVSYKLSDGTIGDEIDRTPKLDETEKVQVLRQIHIATVMSPITAKFIAEWLMKRYEETKDG